MLNARIDDEQKLAQALFSPGFELPTEDKLVVNRNFICLSIFLTDLQINWCFYSCLAQLLREKALEPGNSNSATTKFEFCLKEKNTKDTVECLASHGLYARPQH